MFLIMILTWLNKENWDLILTVFLMQLRSSLRQDPDIIVVSELRDLETIRTAITAAETGHLVISTLHIIDAPKSLDKQIDVFPADQQEMIITQLSNCFI